MGEKKYGVRTVGIDNLKNSIDAHDLVHASVYQPVNYYTAEKLFETITDAEKQTAFVDVGCGKGRMIAMAAHMGFKRIYGFDLSSKLCTKSRTLAHQLEEKISNLFIQIDCKNADAYSVPADAGVLFLFNPFDNIIMEAFARKVMDSLTENPRPLKVLYANPVCKNIWLHYGFVETFHFKKLTYLEGSVLLFQPK